MVLRPEVVAAALAELRRPDSTVILLDPAGAVFRQATRARPGGALAPRVPVPALRGRGRADPVDGRPRALDRGLRADRRRARGARGPRCGPAAPARAPSTRRPPTEESFAAGLLEYPQYTRPGDLRGRTVPPVLVSGHHEQVRKWRLKESLRRTTERRPDLLAGRRPAARRRGSSPSCGPRPPRRGDGEPAPAECRPAEPAGRRAAPSPGSGIDGHAAVVTGAAGSLTPAPRRAILRRRPCRPRWAAPEPVTPAAAAADDRTRILLP